LKGITKLWPNEKRKEERRLSAQECAASQEGDFAMPVSRARPISDEFLAHDFTNAAGSVPRGARRFADEGSDMNGSVIEKPGAPGAAPQAPVQAQDNAAPPLEVIEVILVDDDELYREALAMDLDRLGFRVTGFATGEEMLSHLAAHREAEVILLDWRLEKGLGIDFLAPLHDRGIELPVVFLSGMPAAAAEYAALDRGAVDFVDKARGTAILAKRLRLIVQAQRGTISQAPADSIQCGPLVLRADVRRAYWDGKDVDLTLTEFKIIYALASRPGEFVSYRSIYDCVHHPGFAAGSGEDGFRTNVRSSIRRIRNKFGVLDPAFAEIENYPAFGYRWRGPTPNAII
jgi:two-component system, OmpR family, response regulator ChvI